MSRGHWSYCGRAADELTDLISGERAVAGLYKARSLGLGGTPPTPSRERSCGRNVKAHRRLPA
jgi:hypothetical protein